LSNNRLSRSETALVLQSLARPHGHKKKPFPRPWELRDIAMATTFGCSMGYNFACVIASDTLFDSRGWVFGSSYPMKT